MNKRKIIEDNVGLHELSSSLSYLTLKQKNKLDPTLLPNGFWMLKQKEIDNEQESSSIKCWSCAMIHKQSDFVLCEQCGTGLCLNCRTECCQCELNICNHCSITYHDAVDSYTKCLNCH
ncbi:hypothetical protein K502DRAFT_328608 [Neoconidiobolus thromboides FSU 785]|nr:hypothetical protein K502DRAFT_328608 [Neoconidiobolus thromboides FSU 785]